MARVDLQCGCGYMFFVGDAQLNQPGGVKCPACLAPVKAPGGAAKPAAGKSAAAAKSAPRAAEPEEEAFEDLPAAATGGASKTKLYVVAGGVAGVVVIAIVVLAVVLSKPGVDYEKQAQQAEQARKKMFEEISSTKGGVKPPPAPASTPVQPAPAVPAKAPRSTEYKPMPSEVKPATPAKPATAPATAPATTPAAKPQGSPVTLPTDMIAKVRSEVLSLHAFYLGLVMTPAEKARAEGLSSSGRGLPEDADFLQSVLTGSKLKAARDEVAVISQTLPTLERESQENLPVDKITLAEGGRVLNCKILDEGVEVVKVSRTLASGVGGQLPIRRENISKIEKGKGIGTDFAARWDSAQKGSIATQVELLVWCKENNLAGQAKLVAYTILRGDPSNTQARTEAGLAPDPVKMAEEIGKGGMISYQGKNWNALELRDKFLKDGYSILEGRWYSKKDKMIVVPGLFRYERQGDKPVIIGGTAAMCHDSENVYKQVQDVNTGQFIEQVETKLLRRFYAPPMTVVLTGSLPANVAPPRSTFDLEVKLNVDEGRPPAGTPMKGEVIIQVPVGTPILEASVITVAEVKAGGSITVYHVTGSGDNEKRTKLYTCDPKESQSHVIPTELVRGMTDVNLIAVIEEIAAYIPKTERRHVRGATYKGKVLMTPAIDVLHYRQIPDYKAVLFPSGSNTIEVFRLRLAVADPSPTLDKLFAGVPEILTNK